jgi:STE24 endopeptidase
MIPIHSFLIIFLSVYLTSWAVDFVSEILNARHLERYGQMIPAPFEGIIDGTELKKISRYTIDKIRFNLLRTSVGRMLFLFIILSGMLPALAGYLSSMSVVPAGLVFFAVPALMAGTADLPFSYYYSFVIEERYGFNTRTPKIWFLDLVKSTLVSGLVGAFLLTVLLCLIEFAGPGWWFWAWAVFLGFQLLMAVLYPTVVSPWFNKFAPLENSDLKTAIERLAEAQGMRVQGIYQMDASKRTRHTNAYFTGLGKTRRIVLFDSLIQAHGRDEILAILAHEIGHLKKNHLGKQIAMVTLASFFLFYLASKLLTWDTMYESFGFDAMPVFAGLFLVVVMWEPISCFLSPVAMAMSRRFEREADLYSVRIIGTAKPLSTALKKMARENLSNLRPHPLYVWLNYSHPPLLQRIDYLDRFDTGENGRS